MKNPRKVIIGKEKVDVIVQTYGLREKMNVPAPGHYKCEFSEFSGANIIWEKPSPRIKAESPKKPALKKFNHASGSKKKLLVTSPSDFEKAAWEE